MRVAPVPTIPAGRGKPFEEPFLLDWSSRSVVPCHFHPPILCPIVVFRIGALPAPTTTLTSTLPDEVTHNPEYPLHQALRLSKDPKSI